MRALKRQVVIVAAALGVVAPLCGQTRTPDAESKWTGVRVLELEKVVRIDDGRLLEESQRFVGEVLDAAGRASLSHVLILYPEETGEATLERLERRAPDGTVQDLLAGAPQDVAPVIPPVLPIYSDLRVLRTAVPALEIGDMLTFEYRVSTPPVTRRDLWFEHEFADSDLVEAERFVLDLAEDSALQVRVDEATVELAGERHEDGRWIRTWTRRSGAEEPNEEESPPVRIDIQVSSFADWQEIGAWWLELGSVQTTDSVRAKAEELTAGLQEPRSRLDAIHRFVSQEIRYLGLPLGVGRFRPRPPDEVLRTGFGDCKDKHRLLASLSATVGIEIDPVLISASGRVLDEGIASPAQFDHVVSVARLGDESVWMDATSEMTPSGSLPKSLRDVRAVRLPGIEERPVTELVRTPADLPFPDSRTVETTGEITADGDLRARVRWTIHGDSERIRRTFKYSSPERQRDLVRKWNKEWREEYSEIGDIRFAEPSDLGTPFWYEFDVTWKMGRKVWGQDWEIWIPQPDVQLEEPPEDAGDGGPTGRGLKLETPRRQVTTARIVLPAGSAASPPVPITLERTFASFRSEYRFEDGALVEERELELQTQTVPPSEFRNLSAFREVLADDRAQKFEISARYDLVSESEAPADRLNREGGVAIEEGRPEEAVTLLKQAVEIDPEHPVAWNSLGLALHGVGRLEEARSAFERGIEISPDDSTVYGNLALVYWHEGNYEEAEILLRRQVEVAPLEPFGMRTLAFLLLNLGDDAEAEQWLRRSRRLDADNEESTYLLMWLGLKSGYVDEVNRLASAHPGVPELLRSRFQLADYLVARSAEAWPGFDEWAEQLALDASDRLSDYEGGVPSLMQMEGAIGLGTAWDIRGRLRVERQQYASAERDLSTAYFLIQAPPSAAWLSRAVRARGDGAAADLILARAVVSNDEARGLLGDDLVNAVPDPSERAQLEQAADIMSWPLRNVRETVEEAAGAKGGLWFVFSASGDLEEVIPDQDAGLRPLADRLEQTGISMPFPLENRSRIPIRGEAECSDEGACTVEFESLVRTIRPFVQSEWKDDLPAAEQELALAP